jgi:hypothetical protein
MPWVQTQYWKKKKKKERRSNAALKDMKIKFGLSCSFSWGAGVNDIRLSTVSKLLNILRALFNTTEAPTLCLKTKQDNTLPLPLWFLLVSFSIHTMPCFIVLVLEFEPGPTSWATPTALFCVGCFWDRVSWTIFLGWLWTAIHLISASWVARITGVSHQRHASLV